MVWGLFLLALLSFVVLCYAKSVALGFFCIVLTLGSMLAAVLQMVNSRVDSGARDSGRMITPEELRLIRERAQEQRAAAEAAAASKKAAPSADNPTGPPPSATA